MSFALLRQYAWTRASGVRRSSCVSEIPVLPVAPNTAYVDISALSKV